MKCFLLIFIFIRSADLHVEQDLINHLTSNVSRYARPVLNVNLSIEATFGVELAKLVKVDDREQRVTAEVWVRQNWKTDIFKWNPSEWGGIKRIQLDPLKIWTPDIVLLNNAESEYSGGPTKYKTLINIYSNGDCYWLSPATFTSSCAMDIKSFPFDEQTCRLEFLSWTFHIKSLNLKTDDNPLITENFVNSSEWDVIAAVKYKEDVYYKCCKEPFSHIILNFTFRRKYLYYVFNVIVPCFLLVLAILFGFFLHPESGERISLTITILLAISVFLQLVSESLPRNSDSIPLLALFYMFMMAESVLSLIATCTVLALQYNATDENVNEIPKRMRKIFLEYLAKIVCVKTKTDEFDEIVMKNEQAIMNTQMNNEIVNRDKGQVKDAIIKKNQESLQDNLILKELRYITGVLKMQSQQESVKNEWKIIAKVLDRLSFCCFFFTLIVSTVSLIIPAYLKHN